MFGCFRKGDANDPETYTAAVTAVLADYPEEVIEFATHPVTGIARVMKFLPNPAEVSDFCDAVKRCFDKRERMAQGISGRSYYLVGIRLERDGRTFEGVWKERSNS